mmetsp:Transcript_5935/g.8924  ORF Transcript_5935/g.8924 Transcript_5935/m.8924 type:complete len:99 (-) Transcript_5935:471-767(-)
MRFIALCLSYVLSLIITAESFVISPVSVKYKLKSSLFQEKEKPQQEVTDLNLEEMFEVFEKADKTITNKEVGKKDEPEEGLPDIGRMLGSLFGGKQKN